MMAEAVVRGGTGSDRGTVLGYINELQRRAYGDDEHKIADSDLTLDFLLKERARELYWGRTQTYGPDPLRHVHNRQISVAVERRRERRYSRKQQIQYLPDTEYGAYSQSEPV